MTELPVGNALDYEPDEDAYYISLKGMGGLAKVDRSSGQTPWVLTGAANQLSFPDGPVEIALHHQFQVLDDSILNVDNGDEDIGDSRVVEIAIDTDASTQVVWSRSGEPGRENQVVGPDGDLRWQPQGEPQQGFNALKSARPRGRAPASAAG